MVFQQPNPFRKSIYENIVFAPKRHGLKAVSYTHLDVYKRQPMDMLWLERKLRAR